MLFTIFWAGGVGTDTLKEQIFAELQLVNKDLHTRFEYCVGNSPSRIEILRLLFEAENVTQTTLQQQLNIDRAAVTRHLKQLESAGVVRRFKKENDQRVTWVQLTDEAEVNIEKSFKLKNRFVNETLVDCSEEQLQMFHKMLTTIRENISKVNCLKK
ncbi:MarR family transcriptional regulator [Paenibacillaceae bacterium]|nr:MarR family transcriptional regulator [Paenibacillaceae bacterium]